MGCCVSSYEKSKTTPKINTTNTHEVEFPCESKSPPIAEEEAVKEVLSETPKPKLRPDSRPASPKKRAAVFEGDVDDNDQPIIPKVMVLTPKKAIPEQKLVTKHPDPVTPEEISEVSEMCSFSESISNTTLKEDDDHHQFHQHTKDTAASGEARQRVFRSQGYNGHFHHHQHHQQHQPFHQHQQHCKTMSQGRSPARRRPEPESSPARRRQSGPVGPKREVGGENNNNSARRTQSPGKRANVGRSPSGRRTGPSPGRVRMVGGPENGRKVEDRKEEEEEEARRESEEWQGPKESLENPLVSLECFIFL